MTDLRVRPTMKFIRLAYLFWLAVAVAILIYNRAVLPTPERGLDILLAVPALFIAMNMARHLRRRFTLLSIEGGRLRYESGMLSKSTRTLEVAKVQDVRVDQTLLQRIFNIGALTLETAGETGRLTMSSIDGPQQVAERILDTAHKAAGKARPGEAPGPPPK